MMKNLLLGLIGALVVCGLADAQESHTYKGTRGNFQIRLVLTKSGEEWIVTGEWSDTKFRCPVVGTYSTTTHRMTARIQCDGLPPYSLDGVPNGKGFDINVRDSRRHSIGGSIFAAISKPPVVQTQPPPPPVTPKEPTTSQSEGKLELVLTLKDATVTTDIKANYQQPSADAVLQQLQSGKEYDGTVEVKNGVLPRGETVTVWHPTPSHILTVDENGKFSGVTQPKGFGAQTGLAAYVCTHFPDSCSAQANISIQWKP